MASRLIIILIIFSRYLSRTLIWILQDYQEANQVEHSSYLKMNFVKSLLLAINCCLLSFTL